MSFQHGRPLFWQTIKWTFSTRPNQPLDIFSVAEQHTGPLQHRRTKALYVTTITEPWPCTFSAQPTLELETFIKRLCRPRWKGTWRGSVVLRTCSSRFGCAQNVKGVARLCWKCQIHRSALLQRCKACWKGPRCGSVVMIVSSTRVGCAEKVQW